MLRKEKLIRDREISQVDFLYIYKYLIFYISTIALFISYTICFITLSNYFPIIYVYLNCTV